MAEERWFTVSDIAELLRVHPVTVRGWLREGRIEGHSFGGRTGWRVSETALNAFIEEARGGKDIAA